MILEAYNTHTFTYVIYVICGIYVVREEKERVIYVICDIYITHIYVCTCVCILFVYSDIFHLFSSVSSIL